MGLMRLSIVVSHDPCRTSQQSCRNCHSNRNIMAAHVDHCFSEFYYDLRISVTFNDHQILVGLMIILIVAAQHRQKIIP